jgi:3-hydroxyisobutyrate dehydrogenase-like beta-hydroxyacid dehydrogenase
MDMLARYRELEVERCKNLENVVFERNAIFSLVTADQSLAVAKNFQATVKPDTLFFDRSSCAADANRPSAAQIESAGGRCVYVAVAAPVHTQCTRPNPSSAGAISHELQNLKRTST